MIRDAYGGTERDIYFVHFFIREFFGKNEASDLILESSDHDVWITHSHFSVQIDVTRFSCRIHTSTSGDRRTMGPTSPFGRRHAIFHNFRICQQLFTLRMSKTGFQKPILSMAKCFASQDLQPKGAW